MMSPVTSHMNRPTALGVKNWLLWICRAACVPTRPPTRGVSEPFDSKDCADLYQAPHPIRGAGGDLVLAGMDDPQLWCDWPRVGWLRAAGKRRRAVLTPRSGESYTVRR